MLLSMPTRAAIALSDDEISTYLAAPRTLVLATIGEDGSPHQVALSYVMDGPDPRFWTYRRSQKVRNIERDPRVSCLVEDGTEHFELRGVQLAGRATISTDRDDIRATWRRLSEKYHGPITVAMLANFDRQADKRCVVTVAVDRVASWDHRKLAP
jgi:PPOX class probable F420-dependent enzyme